MNALEQEIITKFRQLDADAQKRVRDMILQEADVADDEQRTLEERSGKTIADWVNEVREERDDDILRYFGFGDTSCNGHE